MPYVEKDITWGLLVSDDQIWSARAQKWMTVLEVRNRNGQVTVRFAGGGKTVPQFTKPASEPARVRRSQTGQVVDMFAVVFSGPV